MLKVLFICAITLITIGCNAPNQPTNQTAQSNPIVGTWAQDSHFGPDSLQTSYLTFKTDQSFTLSQKNYIKNKFVGDITIGGTYAILGDILYLHSIDVSLDSRAKYDIIDTQLRLINIATSDTAYLVKK